MRMFPTLRHSGQRLLLSVTVAFMALIGLAHGEGDGKPDFFDIVGKSPAEVATSIPDQTPYDDLERLVEGFVGLPMSVSHRKVFIEALGNALDRPQPGKRSIRHCLLNLLEEDGRYEDALAVIWAIPPKSDDETVREVGLLWKSGQETEAAELADRIVRVRPISDAWLALVQVDLIKNRLDQAMRLLGFLESRPAFPPRLRHSLALTHLEIARRKGEALKLIEQSNSPVLRAVWKSALGRKDEALEDIKAPGFSPTTADLELLSIALGTERVVMEQTKKMLASNEVSPEQRRALLLAFDKSDERFDLWSGMSAGQVETVDLLESFISSLPEFETREARLACLNFLNAAPDDSRLQLLVAFLSRYEPDQGRSALLKAAVAFRENPDGSSKFADPAATALGILVKTSEASELDTLLTGAPGFGQLPGEVQLRYLMIAQLDTQVVKTLAKCKFDEPSRDFLGSDIAGYFKGRAYGCAIPDDVIAMLIDRLPEIICGSPAKKTFEITRQTTSWIEFLDHQPMSAERRADAINRLVAGAAERNPEVQRAVLAGLPRSVWTLPNLKFTKPEAEVRIPPSTIPAPLAGLSIFMPPAPGFFGQRPDMGRRLQSSRGLPAFERPDSSLLILMNSPWEQNLRDVEDRQNVDAAVQAKVRKLLGEAPSRTIIYDLLVSTGVLPCPDPEVKALADRRIATIPTTPQDDPAIAVFLFLKRMAGGESLEQAAPVLNGLENFLSPARGRILQTTMSSARLPWETRDHRAIQDSYKAIREHLGFKLPAAPVEPPEPPSAYDRLQFFIEAKKQNSPEAVDLARQVLFDFADSRQSMTSPAQNLSIHLLVRTGNFQTFLDDLKTRLVASGASELDSQRAFYHVHRYQFSHSKGEMFPYAKRVLELDPTDTQAALDVLEAATLEKDTALSRRCLEMLCRQSRRLFLHALSRSDSGYQAKPPVDPLAIFTGAYAQELADALLGMPFPPEDESNYNYRDQDAAGLIRLYTHFADHAPDRLGPIIRWAKGMDESNWQTLLRFTAEHLHRKQRSAEAIQILAEAFFTPPPEDSADSHRFKPKNPAILPDADQFNLLRISQIGWLKPLAEAATGYPASPSTAGIRLLIELAANPRVETWNRLFPPFLAGLPLAHQPDIQRQLAERLRYLPDTTELQNFLAKTAAPPPGVKLTPDLYLEKISLASKAHDPSDIPSHWKSMMALLADKSPKLQNYYLTRVFTALASIADDTVWGECLETARKSDGFVEAWLQNNSSFPEESIAPKRVEEMIKLLMPGLKPDERNRQLCLGFFDHLAKSASPDPAVLQFFRPWLETSVQANNRGLQISPRMELLDLISSKIAAASPQVFATPGEDTTWIVDWSLAGFKGLRTGYPYAGNFKFLDGKFDLEILAGPESERLARIATVEKAPCNGRLSVKLPSAAKYISLLAKEHDGEIVRWSHPVRLETPPFGEPIVLAPVIPAAGGQSSTVPAGGPFSREDALDIRLTKGTLIEVARIPWTEGPAPLVSGWILNSASSGSVALSFRTMADVELGTQSLQTADYELENMPFWQRFKTPAEPRMPAETEKIVLIYKPYYQDRPSTIRLSGVRVVPPQAKPLPEGFHSLGRIPAFVDQIAMDSMANRFAVASATLGLGVFDLTTRQFSGWIPLHPPDSENPARIAWLALAGDRLVCVESTGAAWLVSVTKRTSKLIGKIAGIEALTESHGDIALSPDGNFIATHGGMAGTRLLKISDDGLAGERLLETPQIQSLGFAKDSATLDAFGDSNQYSLPLAGWEKAELKITKAQNANSGEEPSPRDWYRRGKDLFDPLQKITFGISSDSNLPVRPFPDSRKIVLPSGLVALDRDKKPFFISESGNILRIETSEIKGFGPPPGK